MDDGDHYIRKARETLLETATLLEELRKWCDEENREWQKRSEEFDRERETTIVSEDDHEK